MSMYYTVHSRGSEVAGFPRCSDIKVCLLFTNNMAPASLTREQVATAQLQGDYAIKSESFQPKLDTSEWPLLLKNYDKLLVRSSHFTPIPSGSSPLKRDLVSYVKCDMSFLLT